MGDKTKHKYTALFQIRYLETISVDVEKLKIGDKFYEDGNEWTLAQINTDGDYNYVDAYRLVYL